MGFGHRVYKAGDPRAAILKGMADEACRQARQTAMVRHVDQAARGRQRARRGSPERRLLLGAALLLARHPGRPVHADHRHRRIAGWTANLLEQYDDNRLIRPRADYKGPAPRRALVAVDKRWPLRAWAGSLVRAS